MVAASWNWKRPNKNANALAGKPSEEGQVGTTKNHHLTAITGHFGERLYWKCEYCGITRRYARDIKEKCPGPE